MIVLSCLLLGACQKQQDEPKPDQTLQLPKYDPDKVIRGRILHDTLLAETPEAKLDVWGTISPDVKACLWIPEARWQAYSKEEREALITYLVAQIPNIRSNPDRYVGIPSTAPIYSKLRNNIVNMKDGAFIIFTMIYKEGQWIQKALEQNHHREMSHPIIIVA